MNISFHRKVETRCPELLFCWCLQVDGDGETAVSDIFIPELYYDYFFIQQGEISCLDSHSGTHFLIPQQTLKTLYTTPLTLRLKVPLILFGARFSLAFAELFWEKEMLANCMLPQSWMNEPVTNLAHFSEQIIATIQNQRIKKTIAPMLKPNLGPRLGPSLVETDWLAAYSPRHKRRLYKSIFGISRKEMRAIENIHLFLAQSCDFAAEMPRIIEYVNTESFYDQPHLNNAFKKVTGLSPMAYFEANSILQDNLMAASYNESGNDFGKMRS